VIGADIEAASWSRPSAHLRTMRNVEVAVLGVVALVIAVAATSAAPAWVKALVIGLVAAAIVLGFLFVRNRCRAWGYLERHEDLLVRRGVMFQRLSVVPYGRMQFVEVTAGLMERLFGLSTVQLHTAAARSDARIPGLVPEEAARLRDRLTALGEAQAAGM
jgi:membrane protein YdbS with pleckstrin-like domain